MTLAFVMQYGFKGILIAWLVITGVMGIIPFFWRFPSGLPFILIWEFFDSLFVGDIVWAIWSIIKFIFSLIFWPAIIGGSIIVLFLESTRRPDRYVMKRRR